MITKKQAIKKQLEVIKKDQNEFPKESELLIAMLRNLARDLLTVQDYEEMFECDLIEH